MRYELAKKKFSAYLLNNIIFKIEAEKKPISAPAQMWFSSEIPVLGSLDLHSSNGTIGTLSCWRILVAAPVSKIDPLSNLLVLLWPQPTTNYHKKRQRFFCTSVNLCFTYPGYIKFKVIVLKCNCNFWSEIVTLVHKPLRL